LDMSSEKTQQFQIYNVNRLLTTPNMINIQYLTI